MNTGNTVYRTDPSQTHVSSEFVKERQEAAEIVEQYGDTR